MQRIECNVQTGVSVTLDLTPDEVAAAAAAFAAEQAALAAANDLAQLSANFIAYMSGNAAPIDISKVMQAKMLSDLSYRLGKAPSQLTAQDIQSERSRVAAIYKAL